MTQTNISVSANVALNICKDVICVNQHGYVGDQNLKEPNRTSFEIQ